MNNIAKERLRVSRRKYRFLIIRGKFASFYLINLFHIALYERFIIEIRILFAQKLRNVYFYVFIYYVFAYLYILCIAEINFR